MVMGTHATYEIGEMTEVSGPRGLALDGVVPCVVLGKATFEDWLHQDPPPAYLYQSVEEYKKCNFYFVSVD